MGVSLEVYRSRIGSHHNFTNCRNRLHCLKGKLWNQILLMFYLNIFYFPYLKSQLKKAKSNREVCHWYVQTKVDHTCTVHADFNQGSELMFGMNAGKQCVAM